MKKIREMGQVEELKDQDKALRAAKVTASNMGVEHLIADIDEDDTAYDVLVLLWYGFCDSPMDENEAEQTVLDEFNYWLINVDKPEMDEEKPYEFFVSKGK